MYLIGRLKWYTLVGIHTLLLCNFTPIMTPPLKDIIKLGNLIWELARKHLPGLSPDISTSGWTKDFRKMLLSLPPCGSYHKWSRLLGNKKRWGIRHQQWLQEGCQRGAEWPGTEAARSKCSRGDLDSGSTERVREFREPRPLNVEGGKQKIAGSCLSTAKV